MFKAIVNSFFNLSVGKPTTQSWLPITFFTKPLSCIPYAPALSIGLPVSTYCHIYNNIVNKIFPTIEGGSLDYYADATYVYACPQCETNVNRLEKGTSLFTKSGFSANEEDMTDVVFIVYINYANIEAYLSENEGVEIVYGLVASANTTGTPLTYANGKVEAAANTVKIDMTGLSYNKLTMRVTNVGNYSLHCAGYVSYNGEISYLNHKTVDETAAKVSLSIIDTMLNGTTNGSGDNEQPEEVPAV